MFKKINRENKKGFTLAELLIVVAIIGVLVAVSIPIFTQQLEKSREATDISDARAYYAEIATALVAGDLNDTKTTIHVGDNYTATGAFTDGVVTSVTVADWTAHQTIAQWQSGAQEVAGVTIAATTDWKDATKITYTFTKDADGDPYLSEVTASK